MSGILSFTLFERGRRLKAEADPQAFQPTKPWRSGQRSGFMFVLYALWDLVILWHMLCMTSELGL
jgi:hypothetical protein